MEVYRPPEIQERGTHTPSTDVWDFGLLLYQLVTLGELPHLADSDEGVRQSIRIGQSILRPAGCSKKM